jgi:hypothetical protein
MKAPAPKSSMTAPGTRSRSTRVNGFRSDTGNENLALRQSYEVHAYAGDHIALRSVHGHGAISRTSSFLTNCGYTTQAVRNAVIEPWSNGQIQGQINRLKTLKRAMFGRANTELLRARLLPLGEITDHRVCG